MPAPWRSNQQRHGNAGRRVPEKLRRRIHRRDGHTCQSCGVSVGPSAPVDHVVPVFEGGTDDPENLRTLCDECHDTKTQAEAQRARAKVSRRRPEDPHPSDGLKTPGEWDRWAQAMGRGSGQ